MTISSEAGKGAASAPRPPSHGGAAALHPAIWACGALLAAVIGMGYLYLRLEAVVRQVTRIHALPPNAIVAFAQGSGKCPDQWREVAELRGRFILGAGAGEGLADRPYGQAGGAEAAVLRAENLPPHRHQVYPSAGEMIGRPSAALGADAGDATPDHAVREGLTGLGTGEHGEPLAAAPVKIMPPYVAYTFCKFEDQH